MSSAASRDRVCASDGSPIQFNQTQLSSSASSVTLSSSGVIPTSLPLNKSKSVSESLVSKPLSRGLAAVYGEDTNTLSQPPASTLLYRTESEGANESRGAAPLSQVGKTQRVVERSMEEGGHLRTAIHHPFQSAFNNTSALPAPSTPSPSPAQPQQHSHQQTRFDYRPQGPLVHGAGGCGVQVQVQTKTQVQLTMDSQYQRRLRSPGLSPLISSQKPIPSLGSGLFASSPTSMTTPSPQLQSSQPSQQQTLQHRSRGSLGPSPLDMPPLMCGVDAVDTENILPILEVTDAQEEEVVGRRRSGANEEKTMAAPQRSALVSYAQGTESRDTDTISDAPQSGEAQNGEARILSIIPLTASSSAGLPQQPQQQEGGNAPSPSPPPSPLPLPWGTSLSQPQSHSHQHPPHSTPHSFSQPQPPSTPQRSPASKRSVPPSPSPSRHKAAASSHNQVPSSPSVQLARSKALQSPYRLSSAPTPTVTAAARSPSTAALLASPVRKHIPATTASLAMTPPASTSSSTSSTAFLKEMRTSPSPSSGKYGDRFIPNRAASHLDQTVYSATSMFASTVHDHSGRGPDELGLGATAAAAAAGGGISGTGSGVPVRTAVQGQTQGTLSRLVRHEVLGSTDFSADASDAGIVAGAMLLGGPSPRRTPSSSSSFVSGRSALMAGSPRRSLPFSSPGDREASVRGGSAGGGISATGATSVLDMALALSRAGAHGVDGGSGGGAGTGIGIGGGERGGAGFMGTAQTRPGSVFSAESQSDVSGADLSTLASAHNPSAASLSSSSHSGGTLSSSSSLSQGIYPSSSTSSYVPDGGAILASITHALPRATRQASGTSSHGDSGEHKSSVEMHEGLLRRGPELAAILSASGLSPAPRGSTPVRGVDAATTAAAAATGSNATLTARAANLTSTSAAAGLLLSPTSHLSLLPSQQTGAPSGFTMSSSARLSLDRASTTGLDRLARGPAREEADFALQLVAELASSPVTSTASAITVASALRGGGGTAAASRASSGASSSTLSSSSSSFSSITTSTAPSLPLPLVLPHPSGPPSMERTLSFHPSVPIADSRSEAAAATAAMVISTGTGHVDSVDSGSGLREYSSLRDGAGVGFGGMGGSGGGDGGAGGSDGVTGLGGRGRSNAGSSFLEGSSLDSSRTRSMLEPRTDVLSSLGVSLSQESRQLLRQVVRPGRKISTTAAKVLDAPELRDDFYLSLLDWSCKNVLAVGLGAAVYLWNAHSSKVVQLCNVTEELDEEGETTSNGAYANDFVASVAWTKDGEHVAVGTSKGRLMHFDVASMQLVRSFKAHGQRIGALHWNSTLLASGGRDRAVFLHDPRVEGGFIARYEGHRQEVCGLRWSFDENVLASGGNDNKVMLWSTKSPTSFNMYQEHKAAVKALAWSPHHTHLLATGGGTADRCIRLWNTQTATTASVNAVDTGSQVCNLVWSSTVNELVSTHGFSQNQIMVWRCPSLSRLATLSGHTQRVLQLSLSPDGQTVVTGAGDETLRFWHVFPSRNREVKGSKLTGLDSAIR